jgi:hypothetical protein
VDLYFYLLGNLAVVLGRGELSLASNGVRKSDGQKRLNPYLTASQIGFLEGLPPVSSTRPSVIAFDRLVAQAGARWPADFVDATLAYLRRSLPEWDL